MQEEKAWYLSKGIWGSLLTVILGICVAFNWIAVAPQEAEIQTAAENIVGIITSVFGLVSFIGRLTAKKEIARKKK